MSIAQQHIEPPHADDEKDRHRFYGQVASSLNSQSAALERAFGAIKGVEEAVNAQSGVLGSAITEQSKVLADMRVTARNIVWVVTLVASAAGSGVGYVFKSYSDMAEKVEKLDRAYEIKEATTKQLITIPDRVSAINSRLNAMEDELESIRKKTK